MSEKKKGLTYAEAGVDIDAGEREVELIKESAFHRQVRYFPFHQDRIQILYRQ